MEEKIETKKENTKPLWIKSLVVILLIVGVLIYFESQRPEDQSLELSVERAEEIISEKSDKYSRAQEITSPDGFINTEEFSLEDYIGEKVILIDFWTYSCINCQRTFPYLNAWHKAYEDEGLVIIGIHTPEFEFEKDIENVRDAAERFELDFPIVLDNDFSTWRAYQNRYWPRKYLIDIDGFVVYDHIGEGAYDETEEKILEALNERVKRLGLKSEVKDQVDGVDLVLQGGNKPRNHETYLGYSRLEYISNNSATLETCINTRITCDLSLPETVIPGTFALEGGWFFGPESVRLESDTGRLVDSFSADTVNLVIESEKEILANIYLDGELITSGAGRDVKNGQVKFQGAKLYNLVDLKGEHGDHELTIEFLSPGIELFAFTFG